MIQVGWENLYQGNIANIRDSFHDFYEHLTLILSIFKI